MAAIVNEKIFNYFLNLSIFGCMDFRQTVFYYFWKIPLKLLTLSFVKGTVIVIDPYVKTGM